MEVGTILLVSLAALGVIAVFPDWLIALRYLLASIVVGGTILCFPVYYRWERLSKTPKTTFQQIAFGGLTFFLFYAAVSFWSLVLIAWQVPPVVNGYYVVTWFGLFLVVVLIIGAVSFYMGVKGLILVIRSRRHPELLAPDDSVTQKPTDGQFPENPSARPNIPLVSSE